MHSTATQGAGHVFPESFQQKQNCFQKEMSFKSRSFQLSDGSSDLPPSVVLWLKAGEPRGCVAGAGRWIHCHGSILKVSSCMSWFVFLCLGGLAVSPAWSRVTDWCSLTKPALTSPVSRQNGLPTLAPSTPVYDKRLEHMPGNIEQSSTFRWQFLCRETSPDWCQGSAVSAYSPAAA